VHGGTGGDAAVDAGVFCVLEEGVWIENLCCLDMHILPRVVVLRFRDATFYL